jgi:sugar fermentation stimulation protein A
VGINTLTANRLVAEAAAEGAVPELGTFDRIVREVRLENSRIDFCLFRGGNPFFLEVKNVTLVEHGVALFPDAPTVRGRKHLQVLMDAIHRGQRSAILFVIQREDAERFAPAAPIDPLYSETLLEAHKVGVETIAYRARVNPEEITLETSLPVDLTAS